MLSVRRSTLNFETREAKIIGKGDRERILHFSEEALEALRQYLAQRDDDHDALFVTHLHTRTTWSRGSAQTYFHRYARQAGISKHVTAHMFRRIFCTTLHRNGADLLTIKDLAGHSDIRTTMQYYIARDPHHLKRQLEKFLKF